MTDVVVIEKNIIQVTTVGIQGPRGPAGPAAPILMGSANIASTNALTIIICASCRYANGYTISGAFGLAVDSGSTVLTVYINGVPVTGLTNVNVTTTPQDVLATANNVVHHGDQVSFSLPGSPTGTNFRYTLEGIPNN